MRVLEMELNAVDKEPASPDGAAGGDSAGAATEDSVRTISQDHKPTQRHFGRVIDTEGKDNFMRVSTNQSAIFEGL
ncbi:MAG: hypothetical protein NTNFB02_05610 [Nitrospira sp.]